jgi:hypothetical protein
MFIISTKLTLFVLIFHAYLWLDHFEISQNLNAISGSTEESGFLISIVDETLEV